MSVEKPNDLIGDRTRDFPACSIVPQPTTLPLAHCSRIECPFRESNPSFLTLSRVADKCLGSCTECKETFLTDLTNL
jgi:hypothetical protein